MPGARKIEPEVWQPADLVGPIDVELTRSVETIPGPSAPPGGSRYEPELARAVEHLPWATRHAGRIEIRAEVIERVPVTCPLSVWKEIVAVCFRTRSDLSEPLSKRESDCPTPMAGVAGG